MGILDFEVVGGRDLWTCAVAADAEDVPEPIWPGLWEREYPSDPTHNPYRRFGINNGDGEGLAVWRAAAWALTEGLDRQAIPAYYRDDAARLLGRERGDTELIDWEYEVDNESDDLRVADRGFVQGRSCVPIRPEPDDFERANSAKAGLFGLASFADLTALEVAVSGDANSEISLFGLHPGRRSELMAALRSPRRPILQAVLRAGELFVDLSIVRDRFPGLTSYLLVTSVSDEHDRVDAVRAHFEAAWLRYLDEAPTISSFEEFGEAVERLLAPPALAR